MTDDRSLERAARSWLEEGPTRAPDRAVAGALDRITTTPQERTRSFPLRWPVMNPVARLAAVAIVAALAIGGSLYLFGRGGLGVGSPPTPTPQPTVAAVPTASASAAFDAYRLARNAICSTAFAEADPLKSRFRTYDETVTQDQRDDWVAAIEAFAAIQLAAVEDLDRLVAPPNLAAGHAANVANLREMNTRVWSIAADLKAGRNTAAKATDEAADLLNGPILQFERLNGLDNCP